MHDARSQRRLWGPILKAAIEEQIQVLRSKVRREMLRP